MNGLPDEKRASEVDYDLIAQAAEGFAEEDPDFLPLFSNVSALIMEWLPNLNWAGVYFVRGDRLVLGPFQGKPACIHIPFGKGVCGTAWKEERPVLVEDVHAFPGHIACDSASRSELVLPIVKDKKVVAVLDLDSPEVSRFTAADEAGLLKLVRVLEEKAVF